MIGTGDRLNVNNSPGRIMVSLRLFFLLMVVMSCSTKKLKEKTLLVKEEWKGRSVEELKEHPYFKNLRVKKISHEDQTETWIYRDQSHIQTSAYCDSLGGCMGMPFYNCDTAFTIKNGVVEGVEQNGGCPGPKTIEPVKKSKE
jgi:hypothetical protein